MQRYIVISLTTTVLFIINSGAACFTWPSCTANIVPGIEIILTDAQTGRDILGATLILAEGVYAETLQEMNLGHYSGADERPGTYTLSVQAAGYEDVIQENIVITADICHVITVSLEIQMNPL